MSVPDSARVLASDDAVVREVNGEAVLLHLTTSQYHVLDPTSTEMWHALLERRVVRGCACGDPPGVRCRRGAASRRSGTLRGPASRARPREARHRVNREESARRYRPARPSAVGLARHPGDRLPHGESICEERAKPCSQHVACCAFERRVQGHERAVPVDAVRRSRSRRDPDPGSQLGTEPARQSVHRAVAGDGEVGCRSRLSGSRWSRSDPGGLVAP